LPKFWASGIAEIELGRDNRKGKVVGFRENYWQPNANMDIEDPVRKNILNGREAVRKLKRS